MEQSKRKILRFKDIKIKDKVPFRYKKIKDKYLLVNEWGDFLYLNIKEFNQYLRGDYEEYSEPHLSLFLNNFLKSELSLPILTERYRTKKSYLLAGPSLHIVIPTLRCNSNCVYCHASARGSQESGFDMDSKTADKMVNIIFKSNNEHAAIEFQGGEPLLNWPIVKYIIKQVLEKNKQASKKLELRLVTNSLLLTDDILNYLLKHKVSLCISLDGPEELHNKNRPASKNSYQSAIKWIKKFNNLYPELEKKGYIWKLATRLTTTKESFKYSKEIIDEHIKLGFDYIYLHHLNPFGFSRDAWASIGYPMKDFLKFYRKTMDYIIKLNKQGILFQERLAATFLTKILTEKDPNHLDYRSPCGAGIGQLAYNYNGDVYTCDEGRMLSMMGDDSFRIGNVHKNTYEEIVAHPVVRTTCIASCNEALPGCEQCVYQPYCGVCPVYNYFEQGSLFVQMPNSERCRLTMGVMDYLFEKMQDKKVVEIFEAWVNN